MFNFIFDGRIGDILAPVVPTNKLFLAIQHHKNDEVNQLILNNDMQRNADGGYSAIHVACRYNNRYALETILSRGVPVEFSDQSGNTPLHYACRYGNIDICKYLIELGASACRKNNQNQTPYDVAGEHHIVRQYLLPLQFQAERSSADAHPTAAPQLGISTDAYYNSNTAAGGQYMTPGYSSNPTPPAQAYGAPPLAYYNGMAPPAATGSEAAPPGAFAPTVSQTTAPAGPPPAGGSMQMYNHSRPAAAPSNTRVIRPDGFHSSASDPALQKKYGHIQQTSNIAPPPTTFPAPSTAAAGPPGAYGASPGISSPAPMAGGPPPAMGANPYAGGGVYSRYVPYDAHTNSAAPTPGQPYGGGVPLAAPQPQSSMFPSFPGMSRSAALPTHSAPSPSPPPAAVGPSGPASGTSRQTSGSLSPVLTPPGSANSSIAPSTAPANRLLGNKALSGGQDILASSSTDTRENEGVTVITANSTSSAVL